MADLEIVDEKVVVEETTDDKIIEKDGDLYIRQEEPTEEPEPEPVQPEREEGKAVEGKPDEVKKDEVTATPTEKVDVIPDEEPAYKDKSREDIIKMHKSVQTEKDRLGTVVGDLKKVVGERELTSEEMRQTLTVNELRTGYLEEKAKLTNIDPVVDPVVDPAEYVEQQKVVDQLQEDWLTKHQEELVNTRFNSADNKKFLVAQKERFEELGIEVGDDEFNEIAGIAKEYLEDGLYTQRSFEKALIDRFGVDKMVKLYTMSGENKARKDIMTASEKESRKVDVSGSGKNAKLIKLDDMSSVEIRRAVKDMSDEELDSFFKKINK